MGDDSPKNKHKLEEQKHEDHVQKDDVKHANAESQHHGHSTPLPETDEERDALEAETKSE